MFFYKKIFGLALIIWIAVVSPGLADDQLNGHIAALDKNGKEPIGFVVGKLKKYDLIIFDDALHTLKETFQFYEELVRDPEFQSLKPIIFFELLPINKQSALDTYFNTIPEDISLTYPAFKEGTGFSFQSYFDLLHTIYEVNLTLPKGQKIIVRGVTNPNYWDSIKTREEASIAINRAKLGRDYDMYRWILDDMNSFKNGKKGVFLTNTRHAYKGLKNKKGKYLWNTGTFFNQWYLGKTYSIRFNAPFLKVEREKQSSSDMSTDGGMGELRFSWRRAAKGLWDTAFAEKGDNPVAISLNSTVFGDAAYLGNNTHIAMDGQTMKDVYDAVIHLTSLDNLTKTASGGHIYTDSTYKIELVRRFKLIKSEEEIKRILAQKNVNTLEEYVDLLAEIESENC
jgi:hypothetical protein